MNDGKRNGLLNMSTARHLPRYFITETEKLELICRFRNIWGGGCVCSQYSIEMDQLIYNVEI